jgi:hypothetical protein
MLIFVFSRPLKKATKIVFNWHAFCARCLGRSERSFTDLNILDAIHGSHYTRGMPDPGQSKDYLERLRQACALRDKTEPQPTGLTTQDYDFLRDLRIRWDDD